MFQRFRRLARCRCAASLVALAIICVGCSTVDTLEDDEFSGGEYLPDTSSDKWAHGRRQLRRMLEDRPQMVLPPVHAQEIYRLAIRGYSGVEHGFPIFWGSPPPEYGYPAESSSPSGSSLAEIRVRPIDGPSIPFSEELWCSFFHEIANLRIDEDYVRLSTGEFARTVTRAQWVDRAMRLEFRAEQENARFYVNQWLPWCRRSGFDSDADEWLEDVTSNYEEWLTFESVRELRRYWEYAYYVQFPNAPRGP